MDMYSIIGLMIAAIPFGCSLIMSGWLLISVINAYTDDAKWKMPDKLAKLAGNIPIINILSKCVDDNIKLPEVIFTIVMLIVCSLFCMMLWPLIVLILAGYLLLRAVRFARRTNKKIASIVSFAHRHTKTGEAKKVAIKTPEF